MNSAYERLKAVITALGYTSNEKFEDTVGLGHGFVTSLIVCHQKACKP